MYIFDHNNQIYDLTYYSWCAADNILYRPINTYILTYPIVTSNVMFGSIIHSSHLMNHQISNIVTKKIQFANNQLYNFI